VLKPLDAAAASYAAHQYGAIRTDIVWPRYKA